jgi:hypothetical protein
MNEENLSREKEDGSPLSDMEDRAGSLHPARFFTRLLGHEPTREQTARFNQIARFGRLNDDDGLWIILYINEFYDERFKRRLDEMDRVSETAVLRTEEGIKKTVRRVMEDMSADMVDTFREKLAVSVKRQTKWEELRSWGMIVGSMAAFFAVIFNAGYVMGAGHLPFWFHPKTSFEWFCSLFFLVPSGWVIFLGSLPYALYILRDSFSSFSHNLSMLFGNGFRNFSLKTFGSFLACILKICFSIFVIVFSCLFFFSF